MDRVNLTAWYKKFTDTYKGRYVVYSFLAAQTVSLLTTIIGLFYILLNVNLDPKQIRLLLVATFGLLLIQNLAVSIYLMAKSRAARSRLDRLNAGLNNFYDGEELAWSEITALPWNYHLAITVTYFLMVVVPVPLLMLGLGNASLSQSIHITIGTLLTLALTNAFTVLFFERILETPRKLLLPTAFPSQLRGLTGMKLKTRLLGFIITIVAIALLSVSPRGYEEAIRAMEASGDLSGARVFNLQLQLLLVSSTALFLGIIFAYGLAWMITRPINKLIETIVLFEEGNYSKRVEILATDEVGVLSLYFNKLLDQLNNLQSNLEQLVEEKTSALAKKTAQLEAAADVAHNAIGFRSLEALLTNTVNLISNRFSFYHTGVFLLDERSEYAVLLAASSEGGQKMIQRGHRLKVGGQSIVGSAAAKKKAYIALDVGSDEVYFNNPDLKDTKSEAALPLLVRGRLIGVLDIQSKERSAFTQDDLDTLQTLANQVALAIHNAKLLEDSQTMIEQLELYSDQKTKSTWSTRIGQKATGYKYSPLGVNALTINDHLKTTAALYPAGNVIEIPVVLRGQTLAVITLKRKGRDLNWSQMELELAEKVSTQVALALENARLLEESQQRAGREEAISQLTDRFNRSLDLDSLLQVAARELQQIPNVAEVSVIVGNGQDA